MRMWNFLNWMRRPGASGGVSQPHGRPQNCLLNLLSAIEYPQITVNTPVLPEKHDYWKAIDYQNLQFARKRPWDRLNPDGLKKGEVQQKDFVDGVGVGETFYAFMAAHLKLKLLAVILMTQSHFGRRLRISTGMEYCVCVTRR